MIGDVHGHGWYTGSQDTNQYRRAARRQPIPSMPRVFLPPPLRRLAGGRAAVDLEGESVAELIEALEARFPGIRARLCDGDRLRPGLNVAVNSEFSDLGLLQRVDPNCEVHFLPAVGGG